MNHTEIPATPSRSRAALAAVLAVLMVLFGTVTAPAALAADGADVNAHVTNASESGLALQVDASGLPEGVTGTYAALIVQGQDDALNNQEYVAFALPFPAVSTGSTSFTLNAPTAKLDRSLTYEVVMWKQHSSFTPENLYGRSVVSISDGQWDAVFPPAPEPEPEPEPTEPTEPTEPAPMQPSIEIFLKDGETPAGDTTLRAGDEIVVKGSGYDPTANVGGRGVPIPKDLPQGTYVVFGDFAADWQPSTGAASGSRSVGTQLWALAESVLDQVPAQYQSIIRAQWVDIEDDGTFLATLTLKEAPAAPEDGSYGVYTYGAGGVNNAAQEQSVLLNYATEPEPTEPEPTEPTDPTEPTIPTPTTPTTPTTPAKPVAGGSLRWAISSSFVNYITGPIAQGEIFVSGGATRSGGQFQFGQAAGSTYTPSTGVGAVGYNGSVRFTGHHGVLDVTVSNPRVAITTPNNATLYVTHAGSRVAFATINLAAATKTIANGAVTYTAAPASLTAAGRDRVLDGNSTTLNPVTFTIGSVAAAPNGTVGTVAAASVQKKAELSSTPPATGGIQIDDESLEALQSGASATVSAAGFQPNEQDIKVVVYSTPVQLGTAEADASGVATWTGTLPATLEDGAHTLTFQGSVNHGLEFTLARSATAAIGQCTVEGASLNWGYKESFRNYIEGIAHGGWDLTDVVYEFPEYVWSDGTGSFDDETGNGLVDFGGTIAFHGHDGALDTKLNNARIELAGEIGYIVFDIAGTTQGGETIDEQGVRFVEFSLADATTADGVLSVSDAGTMLTDSGAAAFGTYAAGESFDPVSFVIPVGADCGAAPVEEDGTAEAPVAAVSAAVEPVAGDAAGLPIWAWVVIGLLVVGAGVGAGVVVQRRRAAASATISED